ncbi:hypothetical protein HPULCUR_008807 [Helicostylum pulchrum]|uniref:HTH APSES-type domain-containing protein n=1 Tax=Helicostylum pulchrum TaxID=562976 RepID=A0ABP9Y8Y1_9FUNG
MSQEKKTDCLTIHPEHDKVSSAILGALVRLGNAPSSPKELANTIMKHKLTTLDNLLLQFPHLNDDDQIKVLRFIELTQPDDQIARLKQGYINATHLRRAAVPVLGEGVFDTQKETVVVITNGPVESRGAWVPLHRARELIEEFEIESSAGLTKLLSDNPVDHHNHIKPIVKDEKKPSLTSTETTTTTATTTTTTTTPRKIAPLTKHLTTSELLKSLNIQNFNLSALQQDYLNDFFPYHGTSSSSSSSGSLFPLLDNTLIPKKVLPVIIYPLQPTNPAMSISMLDHVVVCTAVLKKQEEGIEKEYTLMRRLDNGFINGTQLLTAGGIETERERSMILSFEMSRVRIPNKQSNLFGTWIPSRRAQELAATCSIQHALGDFLDEDIESLFPTPLPISRRASQHQQSTNTNPVVENEQVVNQILNPNNILKMAEINTSHAPLLGSFIDADYDRQITVIDKPCLNQEISDSTDEETDTDNDVEQVRKEIRQLRDRAIAAMEIGNSMQLDDDLFENQPIQLPLKPHKHGCTSKIRRKRRKLKKSKQDASRKVSIIMDTDIVVVEENDVLTHTLVNEDEEDEDVDIGGSDNEDDLR